MSSAYCMLKLSNLSIGRMERHERIAMAIEASGKKKGQIAAECGVANSAVTQWIKGESKSLKLENLYSLSEATGFNAEWLATGNGPERLRQCESNVEPGPPITSPWRAIKIVGTAQMGTEGYWHGLDSAEGYIDLPSRDADAYALRLKGDSMSPAIKSGWIAICEPSHDLVPLEYVMIRLRDGESMVKELLRATDEDVTVQSVNDAYGRRTIPIEQIETMHYVAAIVAPSKIKL